MSHSPPIESSVPSASENPREPNPVRARRLLLVAIVALVGAHLYFAGRHVLLLDDAYISFRYVQNCLMGRGLVFNPGERVEGYSNFLWVVQLVGLGLAGAGPEDAALLLATLYALATFVMTLALVRLVSWRREFPLAAVVALGFLAVNPSYAYWTTGGLETRSQTFFVLLGTWGALAASAAPPALGADDARAARSRMRAALLGALGWSCACLTRPDTPLLFVAATAFAGVRRLLGDLAARDLPLAGKKRRKRARRARGDGAAGSAWRELLALSLPPSVVVGLHLAWRRTYYGDWLPNTYYAKIGDPWWGVGLAWLGTVATEYGLWLLVPFAGWALLGSRRPGARAAGGLMGGLMSLHAVYLARIGGDHFEFRPLDFHWPFLGVGLGVGIARVGAGAGRGRFGGLQGRGWGRWAPGVAGVARWSARVAILLAVAGYSLAIPHATRLATAKIDDRADATLRFVPLEPAEIGPARFLPLMPGLVDTWNKFGEFVVRHASGVRWFEHRVNTDFLIGLYGGFEGMRERGLLPEDAVTSSGAAGIIAYCMDVRVIDLYGLNDRTIARNPKPPSDDRKLAHDREPPPGYLESRGLNMIAPALWGELPAERPGRDGRFVVKLEEGRYLTFESPDPAWAEKAFVGRIVRRPAGGS